MVDVIEIVDKKKNKKGYDISGHLLDTLLSVETEKNNIGHVFGFLHHGEVESNKDKVSSSSKNSDEPLNETGIQQIKEQAKNRKNMGIPKEKIKIHLPPEIVRDVQTARIFCQELGIDFPSDDYFDSVSMTQKQLIVLETILEYFLDKLNKDDIEKNLFRQVSKNNGEKMRKIFDYVLSIIDDRITFDNIDQIKLHPEYLISIKEKVEILQTQLGKYVDEYPNIVCNLALLTTKKGEKVDGKVTYPGNVSTISDTGSESPIYARMRTATYVNEALQNMHKGYKNKQYDSSNGISADIFVGHRTGAEGFLDIKYNRRNLTYDFSSPEGHMDLMLIDKNGKVLNQESGKYFEFDMANYGHQVEELKRTIPSMEALSGKNIVEDTNVVNAYLSDIKREMANDVKHDGIENIIHYLHSKNDIVRYHTTMFLADIIISPEIIKQKKEIYEDCLMDFIENHADLISQEHQTDIFLMLYIHKDKTDIWKKILPKLKERDEHIFLNMNIHEKGGKGEMGDLEKEFDRIKGEKLSVVLGEAIRLYRKSKRYGKLGTRKIGSNQREGLQISAENFSKFLAQIFHMDKDTAQKAAIERLKELLYDTGLDQYFYRKANGLIGYLQQNKDTIKLPMKDQKRKEIILLLRLLGFETKNDLDKIIGLLIGSKGKEHIYEILRSVEKSASIKLNNVVDVLFLGSERLFELLGRQSRLDIIGFLDVNGIREAEDIGKKNGPMYINNNLLVKLSEILRGPINDQVKRYFQKKFNAFNTLDCLNIGGDMIKQMIGGPRKLGDVWNLIMHKHAIYGEGDRFAHSRFSSQQIIQIGEEMRGKSIDQLRKILSEKRVDVKRLSPEMFYDVLSSYKPFAIHKFVGNILGRKISKITPIEIKELIGYI